MKNVEFKMRQIVSCREKTNSNILARLHHRHFTFYILHFFDSTFNI
jgi:hypothetical protein